MSETHEKPEIPNSGCFYFVASVLIFSILIIVSYLVWHPLAAAVIVFLVGSWGASLLRLGIKSVPGTLSSMRRISVSVTAFLWGGFVALLATCLIVLLSIPTWAAALLFVLGWMSVTYPIWVEVPNLARYVDSSVGELAAAYSQEKMDRLAAAGRLLENFKFFRLVSTGAYVGCILPPIMKHFMRAK